MKSVLKGVGYISGDERLRFQARRRRHNPENAAAYPKPGLRAVENAYRCEKKRQVHPPAIGSIRLGS
jgi:hypothetical protein